MAFCSYCGCQVGSSDRFCPNCGASLAEAVNTTTTTQTTANTTQTTYTNTFNQTYTGTDDGKRDYEVVLSGLGSCASSTCNDLLEDLLGYTDAQASQLIANIPVKIGDNLTYTQAQTIAQALTEYGALISVINGNENVEVSTSNSSLFNSDGSFIGKALAILSTITLANRVTSYKPYRKPSLLERIFRLPFRRKEPPKHIRRPVPRRTYVRPQNFRNEHHEPPKPQFRQQFARPQQMKSQTPRAKQPGDFTSRQRPSGSSPRSGGSNRSHGGPGSHRDGHGGPGRH